MIVLVSTKDGQGLRSNDFCWTEPGEYVVIAEPCDGETIDGPCGCMRSFSGLSSLKATTTAKLVDMPGLQLSAFVALVEDSLRKSWPSLKPDELRELATAEAATVRDIGRKLAGAVGRVVERRGNTIQTRVLRKAPHD